MFDQTRALAGHSRRVAALPEQRGLSDENTHWCYYKLVNVIVCDHVTIKKIVLLWREAKRRLLLWQLIIVEKRHCYCYDTHAHSGLSIVVRTPIPSPSTLVFTVLAKKCLTTTVSLTWTIKVRVLHLIRLFEVARNSQRVLTIIKKKNPLVVVLLILFMFVVIVCCPLRQCLWWTETVHFIASRQTL